ncbi:unnamed protein product [Symbiodinium sp. CCMP2592]|nr:unnamed protein product [Symbiodinium sp. CCMP2592]
MHARSCKKCEDQELSIQSIKFVGGAQCNLSGRQPPRLGLLELGSVHCFVALPRMFAQWCRFLLLPTVVQSSVTVLTGDGGFCEDGRCINCNFCDGDCFDACSCNSELNTCCCLAPPGHFSRGYEKISCPGGTYQDLAGQRSCKPCSTDASVLFNVDMRGAVDLVDCEEAKCSNENVCGANLTDCSATCVSSIFVETAMYAHPTNTTFCSGLEQPIAERGCSWQSTTSAAPVLRGSVQVLLSLIMLCTMKEL